MMDSSGLRSLPILRLAILTTEYPPFTPYDGGIGTLYASLAPRLAGLGQDVHVFALSHDRDEVQDDRGVRLHRVRARMRIGSYLEPVAWSLSATRAMRRHGPFDAVWAPEWFGSAWAYSRRRDAGPLVTQLCASRVQVAELAGGWPRFPPEYLDHRIQSTLERRQTERSDALIAQSQAVLDWAKRLWNIADLPVRVLPSVLDVGATRALGEGPEPEDLPEGRPRVVFFGRLERLKGVDVLVRAMSQVWERFPGAPLLMLGDGENGMAPTLRALAGSNAEHVHLMGHRTGNRLFPVIRAADVVALPSRWENFALAALEAMALGRPVVLSSAGGAPEFCTDGADSVLVPPDDAETLGGAIRRVLEAEDLRERLGREAAKTAESYDISQVAPRYLSYFEELAGKA
jgi:glycogen(starch) synthase